MDKKQNHLTIFIIIVVVIIIIVLTAYFYAKSIPTGDILGAESAERGKPEEIVSNQDVIIPEIDEEVVTEDLLT